MKNHLGQEVDANGIQTPGNPANPQSEVKKLYVCEKFGCLHDSNGHQVTHPKESPVSQTVEGWERELMKVAFYEGSITAKNVRKYFVPFFSTTLSTLVKEMEKNRRLIEKGTDELGRVKEPTVLMGISQDIGFNAGISAAIEVVKKMV